MKPTHATLRRHALAAAITLFAAYGLADAPAAQAAEPAKPDIAARGRYLVNTSGCMDCHTPLKMGPNGPEPDLARLLSGHPQGLAMPPVPTLPEGPWLVVTSATNTAWAGPWGVSFTANLTPDPETGLGNWTVSDFKQTIRTGRHLGRGRAVLPPMPIPVYNNFSDEDLEAVFAYLRTIPPVKNRVPEPWVPAAAPTAMR
ncbi:diheme cytochrome c-553 [Ideonella sp.]|uniref:c-type cytochrome n=1 Tax=Ideonella sp. TaxID=1929293 RepID=UPI002B475DCA|nr:diheme cytochrome c-553 [Ideonella sp.]HJV69950.1 diheme cytochrome c-553 [Ideonella sp.]